MRLTVLGSSAVRPNPGAACSGYLLEAGDTRLLIDCGSGVLAQLLRHLELADLTAVLISHAHPDHCLDLVNIRQALAHAPGRRRSSALPVYAGPGVVEVLVRLAAAFGDPSAGEPDPAAAFWRELIRFETFDPDRLLAFGDLSVRFAPSRHYVPCWAMRFEHAGRVLAFSADTGPSEAVTALARGADLVLAESTLVRRNGSADGWGHMAADEAGRLAREAGAGRLLLTHFFAEDAPALVAAARAAEPGLSVVLAREGEQHVI